MSVRLRLRSVIEGVAMTVAVRRSSISPWNLGTYSLTPHVNWVISPAYYYTINKFPGMFLKTRRCLLNILPLTYS
jgi:hypothetical protein